MEKSIKYKIYELDEYHLAEKRICLQEIETKGWDSNSFESFDAAVKYLQEKEYFWNNYTILPIINITDYGDNN